MHKWEKWEASKCNTFVSNCGFPGLGLRNKSLCAESYGLITVLFEDLSLLPFSLTFRDKLEPQ